MEPYLPHLETLHLGFNGMSKLGSGDGDTVVGGFARLKLLSLESNTFESWSQVLKLRRLPRYIFIPVGVE